MKRFISVLLVLLLLGTSLFSVSAETTVEESAVIESIMTEEDFRNYSSEIDLFSTPYSENYVIGNGYYYTYLDRNDLYGLAKSAYDMIMDNLESEPLSGKWTMAFETEMFNGMTIGEFDEIVSIVMNELASGAWCFRYDNPSKCDRFTNSVRRGYSYSYSSKSNIIVSVKLIVELEVHPYFTQDMLVERDKIINEIVEKANRKPSQYLALKYVHDTLDNMAEYDYDNIYASSDSEEYLYDHSALGILSGYGKGVCESYAKAFMEICRRLDDAPYVGLMTSETHMWNIVLLDGEWYCVDLTWDDSDTGDISDKYFLCEDPDIVDGSSNDHVPDGKFTVSPVYATEKYVFSPIDGDVTFDGEINLLDIIRFKRIYTESLNKEFYENADLDGNSVYNALDLARLKIQVIG